MTISLDFDYDSITALVEFSSSSCKFGFQFCSEVADLVHYEGDLLVFLFDANRKYVHAFC